MQQNGRPGVEEGEQFSVARIISITKVRPSRGHATGTSKTRDCDVAKQNLKNWKVDCTQLTSATSPRDSYVSAGGK